MQSDALRALYGWSLDSNGKPPAFDSQYSKVSIENLILYIVAYCAYAIEVLMDHVKEEIETEIASKEPGRPQWYIKKLKEFIHLPSLPEDVRELVTFDDNTGEYIIDPTANEGDINKARIVHHAVAIDNNQQSLLILKVAGEDDEGNLSPLWADERTALENYISRIKYAGVKTVLISERGDDFNCNITIWYDPLQGDSDTRAECERAIERFIKSLPFNGEYSNMALIDSLQAVNGVKVAELTSASYINTNTGNLEPINAKVRPYSGYFNVGEITLEMISYE